MNNRLEEEIVNLVRSKEKSQVDAGLRRLYSDFWPEIEAFLTKKGVVAVEIPDIYQDAVVVLYEKLRDPDFKLTSKLGTFLFAIASHMASNSFRRRGRIVSDENLPELIETESDVIGYLEERERNERLGELVSKLSEKCQRILRLYYYERYTMAEIAKDFGYSSEQVAKNRKSLCIKELKSIIKSSKSEWL